MYLSVETMMSHPRRQTIIRHLADAFIGLHAADSRAGTVFSTQQRWLMAHAGMAQYFRELAGDGPAFYSRLFLEKIETEEIAARNTAHAFLLEMQKYGVVRYRSPEKKSKTRLLSLSDATIEAIAGWLLLHLHTLDGFDDGTRSSLFRQVPTAVYFLQPAVADELIASQSMRVPRGAFAHFTWLNEGGFIMDCLMASLQPALPGEKQILTSITSAAELAERAWLSRTHLARKLRVAEDEGFLGWTGRRGRSTLWLSSEFQEEYEAYQVNKLALIDTAFNAVAKRLTDMVETHPVAAQ